MENAWLSVQSACLMAVVNSKKRLKGKMMGKVTMSMRNTIAKHLRYYRNRKTYRDIAERHIVYIRRIAKKFPKSRKG